MTSLSKLTRLETTIANGMETFIDVGNALKQIRDEGLYRDGYQTFQEYVKERWGWDKTYAYRLIKVAEVDAALPMGDSKPTNERQFREVAKAPADKQAAVVEAAAAKAEAEDRKPTAKDYREAVAEVVYEDAIDDEPEPCVAEKFDRKVIDAFRKCENRLGTLKQLASELSETEREILKEWLECTAN